MEKGIIRMIEVFLAINLLVIFLSTMQATTTPEYTDPFNFNRLNKNSEDLALSICNNEDLRKAIIEEEELPPDLSSNHIPKDLEHGLKLYNGTYFNNLIDQEGEFPNKPGVATSGCIIVGSTDNTTTNSIESYDAPLTLSSGENAVIEFPVEQGERGYENLFGIKARQNGTGETTISVKNETEQITVGSISFSTEAPEYKAVNMTKYLPDSDNEYKITIEPDVRTQYTQIEMNITQINPNYNPHKVLVGVWNR